MKRTISPDVRLANALHAGAKAAFKQYIEEGCSRPLFFYYAHGVDDLRVAGACDPMPDRFQRFDITIPRNLEVHQIASWANDHVGRVWGGHFWEDAKR